MFNPIISSSYLTKYDLIDRFDSNVLAEYPKLTKISIDFSLKQLKNHIVNRKDANVKLKGFLILYILFGLNPILNYNSVKTFDLSVKKNDESFFNEILNITHSDEINSFIHFLFIQNNLQNVLKGFIKQKIKIVNSNIILTLTFPMSVFADINEFCSLEIIEVFAKDLTVDVSFSFKNCTGINESNISILMPFWHFG